MLTTAVVNGLSTSVAPTASAAIASECGSRCAYGWAFSKPVRKVYYNLTVTGLSIAVAQIIGTVELLGLAVTKLGLKGAFWSWVSQININNLGYGIVAMFILTWALALLVWRAAHIGERWGAGCGGADAGPDRGSPALDVSRTIKLG